MRSKLDPNIWRQVSPLLDSALSLEGETLAGFMTQVRVDRPDLAGVLEDLLAEHGHLREDNFLALPDTPSEIFAGTVVGAYTGSVTVCASSGRPPG